MKEHRGKMLSEDKDKHHKEWSLQSYLFYLKNLHTKSIGIPLVYSRYTSFRK